MRLVHMADLHLGYRAYQRLTPSGINQRESDVARAFQDAVDQVIAIAPEVVVVAGDIFHASRPPNNAIVHAHRQFGRLRAALPGTVVVIVAGNHDAPRTADTGAILPLFESLGIHVAAFGAKRIYVPELNLSVLAVPDVPGVQPLIAPDPEARYNVLVLHGEVEYAAAGAQVPWDYVALGHYHVHSEIVPRVRYAGALDYTSSNPWGELAEQGQSGGKGFVLVDLDTHVAELQPVRTQRVFMDLEPIEAGDKTAEDIDALIAERVAQAPYPIDGAVVRLVIRDIPRPIQVALDQRKLRTLRLQALHFQMVCEKPKDALTLMANPARRRQTLHEIVRSAFAKRECLTEEDREKLASMAITYLEQAGEQQEDTRYEPAEPIHA